MQTKYVPMHSRDHADSEYLSYAGVDIKGAEFTGNKHTNNSLTYSYTNTQLYILLHMTKYCKIKTYYEHS